MNALLKYLAPPEWQAVLTLIPIAEIINLIVTVILEAVHTLIPSAIIISLIVTVLLDHTAEKRACIARTIQLHEAFLSPDFYANVRAPAFNIGLQWTQLPESIRKNYREAVVSGWADFVNEFKLATYVQKTPKSHADIISYHFQTPVGMSSLTEHQALTAYLRFWTRFNVHRKRKTINATLAKALFVDEFEYQFTFFRELAESISNELESTAVTKPRWIDDISELSEFFDIIDR